MDKLEIGASTALVGAGIFSIHSHYRENAGSLSECRKANPDDNSARQKVLDADVLTGGLVLLVGGSLAVMTKSAMPLGLAILGFALISVYYHSALNGPSIAVPHVNASSIPTGETTDDDYRE